LLGSNAWTKGGLNDKKCVWFGVSWG